MKTAWMQDNTDFVTLAVGRTYAVVRLTMNGGNYSITCHYSATEAREIAHAIDAFASELLPTASSTTDVASSTSQRTAVGESAADAMVEKEYGMSQEKIASELARARSLLKTSDGTVAERRAAQVLLELENDRVVYRSLIDEAKRQGEELIRSGETARDRVRAEAMVHAARCILRALSGT